MSAQATQITNDWSEQSTRLESASPIEIVRWAMETFSEKLTFATAFGAEGCTIVDMIARLRDEFAQTGRGITPDIFNLDTGYQFPQTLALKSRLEKKYDLSIRFVRPAETPAEAEARLGGPPCLKEPDVCCHQRKVVPLSEALRGFSAYITAVRRDQTPERAGIPIIGFDPRHAILKISPLANWTKDDVWAYIRAHDVPTNPLHEQGFSSIGCWPVTRPVRADEDERAGRWAGSEKRECGLHLHSHAVS
jgi:phosphoadenosine phosphosulfate reductase